MATFEEVRLRLVELHGTDTSLSLYAQTEGMVEAVAHKHPRGPGGGVWRMEGQSWDIGCTGGEEGSVPERLSRALDRLLVKVEAGDWDKGESAPDVAEATP